MAKKDKEEPTEGQEPEEATEPFTQVVDPIDVPDPEAFVDATRPEPPTLEEALQPIREGFEGIQTSLSMIWRQLVPDQQRAAPPFEFSEKTDKLFPALHAFHKECAGVVEKDSVNPFFSSSYASRAQVKKITHGALMEAGLFVMNSRQVLGFHEQNVWDKDAKEWKVLNCCRMNQVQRIVHAASGQYVQTSMLMDSHGTSPQAMGTVDSYGARYNSVALLDLAAEDDDGNAGSGRPSGKRQTAGQKAQDKKGGRGKKKPPASQAVIKLREELMTEIKDRIEEAGLLGEVQPSKILKEITAFPRPNHKDGDFKGYDDLEQVTAKGMVEASWRRLQNEHPMLSDEALGRGA